jgi:hypothetical protein
MSIGSWWDQNVKQPINKVGQAVTNTVRGTTNALGLTTPSIPASAQGVVDQGKMKGLATYQGVNQANVDRWNQNGAPGGPGYYNAPTYTPQQYASLATPTMQKSQDMSYAPMGSAAPTEQSQGGLNLTNTQTMDQSQLAKEGQSNLGLKGVSGYMPQTAQYSNAASGALKQAQSTQPITTQGYDPAQKQAAIDSMTAGLQTQQDDATKAMTEQLSRAGILNSSAGQAQLAKLKANYDQQRTNAMTQVNLQDLEAQRSDRYTNANLANTDINQVANLAASGQGMGIQQASAQAALTAQDNSNAQAQASWNQGQRSIDNNTAMQLAGYNQGVNAQNNSNAQTSAQYGQNARQLDIQNANSLANQNFGNQMATNQFNQGNAQNNNSNAWNTYNAQNAADTARANQANEAQQYNIGNTMQGKQLEAGQYQTDLGNLATSSGGSIYTPQSQAANQTYEQQQAQQAQNAQATWGGIGALAKPVIGAITGKKTSNTLANIGAGSKVPTTVRY